MAALLAQFRFVRWVFLLVLLVSTVSASVGCAAFHDYECEDDSDTAGYHRGGSVSPGVLNARTGYRNG